MKATRLLHPLFLFSLFLFLLNDLFLKSQLHNWFTGKLSDFAGLFAFTVFMIALLPGYKKVVVIFSALFFCWWKSPLSSGFIHLVNEYMPVPLHRAVDYTDLAALIVLPFTLYLKPVETGKAFLQTVSVYTVSVVAIFSFCATSAYRHLYYTPYRENELYFGKSFNTSLSEKEVIDKLTRPHGQYKKDSVRYFSVLRGDELVYRVNDHTGTDTKWIPASNNDDSSLYVKRKVQPFYIIPYILTDADTLFNAEVEINGYGTRKKPTYVRIHSYQLSRLKGNVYYSGAEYQKYYRKYFNKLFREK